MAFYFYYQNITIADKLCTLEISLSNNLISGPTAGANEYKFLK